MWDGRCGSASLLPSGVFLLGCGCFEEENEEDGQSETLGY